MTITTSPFLFAAAVMAGKVFGWFLAAIRKHFVSLPNKTPEPTWLAASVLPQGCGLFFGLVLTWLSFFR